MIASWKVEHVRACENDSYDIVPRIIKIREYQTNLDEEYKNLVVQLGVEVYVQTKRDANFRALYDDLYRQIEEIAVQCQRNHDYLGRLENRAKRLGLALDEKSSPEARINESTVLRGHHAAMPLREEKSPENAIRAEIKDRVVSCPRCGIRVDNGDVFCGECGAPLAPSIHKTHQREEKSKLPVDGAVSSPRERPQRGVAASKVSSSVSKLGRLSAIFDLIAIALMFLPWVNLNLYVWSGSYSIPSLIQLAFNANSAATNYLGSNYTNSSISTNFMIVVIIVAVFWLTIVGLLAYDAYVHFTDSKHRPTAIPMGGFVFLSLAVIIGCFAGDITLSGQFAKASLSVSGVLSAASGTWISLIVGTVFACYLSMKKE